MPLLKGDVSKLGKRATNRAERGKESDRRIREFGCGSPEIGVPQDRSVGAGGKRHEKGRQVKL